MKKTLLLFIIILSSWLIAAAKHSNSELKTGLDFFYNRGVELEFPKNLYLPNPENDKLNLQFISSNLISKEEGVTLEVLAKKNNNHSKHILIQQNLKGYPVYGAQFKINYLNKGKILSYSNGFFSIPENLINNVTEPKSLDTKVIIQKWLSDKSWTNKQLTVTPLWLYLDDDLQPILQVIVNVPEEVYFSEWLVDANGNTIAEKDLNRYLGRATATAKVFNPDPLTTAETFYGGNYIDSNDVEISALNNELKTVSIDVYFDNLSNTYQLISDFLRIVDMGQPSIAPPTPSTAEFNYTRGEDQFEAVNAYYHIQRFANYIESIGFDQLLTDQIMVDGNGRVDDQSIFSPSNPPRINFGEGGVDDAEDADVVVHEYGHYVSHAAAPFTNEGFERTGIDEGLCDYFAASYSKADKEFRWFDVFTWDGHNEYWTGRSANTSKVYPEDLSSSSIHSNGEILSSAMMKIQEMIGRDKTDAIMVQAIYSFSSNMDMLDAGRLILQADTVLFSGENYCTIYSSLNEHGLVDSDFSLNACLRKDNSIVVPVLSDISICAGETTALMDNPNLDSTFSYFWRENYTNLINQDNEVPEVSPENSSVYQLEVRASDGRYNTAEMNVFVERCDFDYINTMGFAEGSAPMLILLPEKNSLRPKWVRLIDLSGKVNSKMNVDATSESMEIKPDIVPPGVYIIQMHTNEGKYVTKKVLRLN